jgi:hypothetical protein
MRRVRISRKKIVPRSLLLQTYGSLSRNSFANFVNVPTGQKGLNFELGHYPISEVDGRSRGDLVGGKGLAGPLSFPLPVGVRAGDWRPFPRWPVLFGRIRLVENDPDCVRCKHSMSQHEIEDDSDDNGDTEHKTRGACEVRSCFCPRFSPPP